MAAYKEIVTKAIVGKGKKYFKNNYSLVADEKPSTVLGCWVINHNFKGYKSGNNIGVDGSYDVNIWYSYDNDSKTAVMNKKINYNELFNIKTKNDIDVSNDNDIIVRTLKQPTCTKVDIGDNNTINFNIEKELGVELVGDTKVKIAVEDDEEPWQNLNEELNDVIDNQVNENYLNDNVNQK